MAYNELLLAELDESSPGAGIAAVVAVSLRLHSRKGFQNKEIAAASQQTEKPVELPLLLKPDPGKDLGDGNFVPERKELVHYVVEVDAVQLPHLYDPDLVRHYCSAKREIWPQSD
ncbi:hypothetical protein Nepgr_005101 [Nepenthes gracilis]|uniref:Uncharacterized protein n=1 Tax=Nepenthes gracilis TaxID=150966 RepID=A0AAD3S2J7_NEPGR|nr:hypothetical protein Nepgr_005101 [Nepenthes gracilis]